MVRDISLSSKISMLSWQKRSEEMRQTTVGDKAKRKVCSQCGATSWLRNQTTGEYTGPWHFNDCPSIPGGAELNMHNIDEKARWEQEKRVPKEQGARILKAINLMLFSPNHEVMLERKAAIQGEICQL